MREALIVLWEASDRICGKRLKAMIPTLLPAMERYRHPDLVPEIRAALVAISAATIDRALRPQRERVGAGTRRRGSPSALRRSTVSTARASIGLYLAFYNGRRPHSSLNRRTPDQAYFDRLPHPAAA